MRCLRRRRGREVIATWPAGVADMLLSAYAAAVDRPALVTSTIEEISGTPARTFRQWAIDHAADFCEPVGSCRSWATRPTPFFMNQQAATICHG